MAEDGRILWVRPEGCLCGVVLKGAELNDGTDGPLRMERETRPECPLHGFAEDLVEAAVEAAQRVLSTVPGMPRLSPPQIRRLVLAALPVIQEAVDAGVIRPTEPEPSPDPAA